LFTTLTGMETFLVTPAMVSLPAIFPFPIFTEVAVKLMLAFLSAFRVAYALLSIILPFVLFRFLAGMVNFTLLMLLPLTVPLKDPELAFMFQSCIGEVPSTVTCTVLAAMLCADAKPPINPKATNAILNVLKFLMISNIKLLLFRFIFLMQMYILF